MPDSDNELEPVQDTEGCVDAEAATQEPQDVPKRQERKKKIPKRRERKVGISKFICFVIVVIAMNIVIFFAIRTRRGSEQTTFVKPLPRPCNESTVAVVATSTPTPVSWGIAQTMSGPTKNGLQPSYPTRVAYAWYLTEFETESIACAILVAAKAVQEKPQRAGTEYVVVHTINAVPSPERFAKLHIRLIKVRPSSTRGQHQWVASFVKLRVAELLDYDRVIYFDVDTLPVGNLANLFDIAPFPIELAAPRAYWLGQPFVQSGGPMVIDPQRISVSRHFSHALDMAARRSYGGEMDWVNEEFRSTVHIFSGFYALLIGEWCPTDGIYRHWQKHFNQSSRWLMDNAQLVHFIAQWKPWKFTSAASVASKCPRAQPELLMLYQRWWALRAQVC